MGRAPCCDKNGLKKGPWTPEEDQKLIDYIQKHGYRNWRTLPKNAGLQRCGKSCRLRWTNYLRPDIKRGRFSFDEEETIIQLHSMLGNKWSAIAARLPGRTDNEIKNYWNTHIRKRLLRMGIDPVTHSPRLDLLDLSSILSSSLYNSSQTNISRFLGVQPYPELIRLATSLMSTTQCEEQNPNFLFQNVHNPQIPLQEIPECTTLTTTTTTTPCVSFSNVQAQLLNPNEEQLPADFANFSYQNSHQSEWQSNGMPSNLTEDYVSLPPNYYYYGSSQTVIDPSSETSNFHSNNSFMDPSSSPTQLNSNSTYNSTEDERESYCSNMFKFEIPDIFDAYELM